MNMSPSHLESWNLQSGHNAGPFTCGPLYPSRPTGAHLGYNWGDFETEEDLVEDELYECIRQDMENDREDASGSSSDLTPTTSASEWWNEDEVSNSPSSPESDRFRDPIVEAVDARLSCLAEIADEILGSIQREIRGMRELIDDRKAHIQQLPDFASEEDVGGCPSEEDEAFDDDLYDATPLAPSRSMTIADRYTEEWHNGGLILVENISDQAGAHDVHAAFHACGEITYVELHGPNASGPHIATRYAYVHFAQPTHATKARHYYHGFEFMDKTLMVFLLSTSHVRGEPGVPYVGTALEILNFNGGQNYKAGEPASSEAAVSGAKATKQPATRSPKPKLTTQTDFSSWRPMVMPKAAPLKPKLTLITFVPTDDHTAEPEASTSDLLLPAYNTTTKERAPSVLKPKLTLNTKVARVDLLTGDEPPPPKLITHVPLRPVEVDKVDTGPLVRRISYGESDRVQFKHFSSVEPTDGDSPDDELVVFQGPRKKVLRPTLEVDTVKSRAVEALRAIVKANEKSLGQAEKKKTFSSWKPLAFVRKAISFYWWGR
ncbi:MAG: hypothetical protein LQ350_002054 [Teloschistes chrysophthalmus]|nr:MAG: hypothetical protein LQ350_002054 [Niorma chrysophthalma]